MQEELKNSTEQASTNKAKKTSKYTTFNIVALCFLVLAHIAVIVAIALSFKYYAIYPSLFGSVVSIVICLLIIADIIFFVGFNHKDMLLKVISCILIVFLFAGGTVGTYAIAKVNGIVDSILDDGTEKKTETFSGVFVCYDANNKFSTLSELANKKVGMLTETSNGLTYIATDILKEQKVDYATVNYSSNTALLQGLVTGEVDAVVITTAYREIYSKERDENSPFADYLENFIDFYSFEKELEVDTNKNKKNLNTDPFNVLLIGYSRTEIGSSIGLADSIILVTINPQTYTVSMMSIARDSFVPIACYGGEYDKINSGRSTSRACFIETVENFVGMDIDYYMELDYLGLVQIVNTIGGVVIDNPVDFELDGISVPAGRYLADGQQALQFCRERHHMPNGDFDRQQHQKEVIIAIAKKFIESGSVSLALEAMENASDWMSTDLTLNQLTTVFNLLLNTKNYTSMDTFDLVDFQTLRITGNGGIMYYSYSMHLPLWVYLVYQGSYDESMKHIQDVMGNYPSYDQEYSFNISMQNQYVRPPFYSETYPEEYMFTPDPMPAYWPSLSGMNLAEAYEWANANGVTLTVDNILPNDPNYDAEYEGLICDQSVRYGSLVSEYKNGKVTLMGTGVIDEDKVVPSFVGHSYTKAVRWAKKHDIPYSVDFDINADESIEIGDVVSQSPKAYIDIEECDKLRLVVRAGSYTVTFNKNGLGEDGNLPVDLELITGQEEEFKDMKSVTEDGVTYIFDGWYTTKSGDEGIKVKYSTDIPIVKEDGATITLYARWKKLINVTFDYGNHTSTISTEEDFPDNPTMEDYVFDGWYTGKKGSGTKYSSFSGIEKSITLYANWNKCEHDFSEWETVDEPTCETEGTKHRICHICDKEETDIIEMLSGDACIVEQN